MKRTFVDGDGLNHLLRKVPPAKLNWQPCPYIWRALPVVTK